MRKFTIKANKSNKEISTSWRGLNSLIKLQWYIRDEYRMSLRANFDNEGNLVVETNTKSMKTISWNL